MAQWCRTVVRVLGPEPELIRCVALVILTKHAWERTGPHRFSRGDGGDVP